MYRQGDILLVPCDPLPRAERKVRKRVPGKGIIVAAGEATGHHHRVKDKTAREYRSSLRKGRFLFVSSKGAELTHEEHETISLPPGTYEIVQQREYVAPKDEFAAATVRPVYD